VRRQASLARLPRVSSQFTIQGDVRPFLRPLGGPLERNVASLGNTCHDVRVLRVLDSRRAAAQRRRVGPTCRQSPTRRPQTSRPTLFYIGFRRRARSSATPGHLDLSGRRACAPAERVQLVVSAGGVGAAGCIGASEIVNESSDCRPALV
jgi:hypothetical protein